ncbi:MAG: hypothetical protein M1608_16250, partial [Candidatus Omnitrophica bacterium]|nr:hypothetical protein [Candidatus Omnitrophota bacterium]
GIPVVITQAPVNATTPEAGTATFSVTATGAPPLHYQWLRDGTAIPGATTDTYSLAKARVTDNGALFSVQVIDGASTVQTSSEAVLTVIPDTQPPSLVSATNLTDTTISVRFSEPVSADTAAAITNYTLAGGVKILDAQLSSDQATVVLTTEPAPYGPVTLTVSGVRDASAAGNPVAANSTASYVHTAKLVIPVKDRASGVDWDLKWSNPNQTVSSDPLHLSAGKWGGQTSSQIRFDLTPMKGIYSSIYSIAIRLTQQVNYWNGRQSGVLEVYRLSTANAGWNSYGTWGTMDGTNAWAGGTSGAMTPDTDYVNTLLASVPYQLTPNPVGTVYDLVIPAELATPFLETWINGGVNEGFLLRANGSDLGDNHILFFADGPDAPQLIVDYIPVALPELSVAQSGNQLILSWTAAGYILQEKSDLSSTSNWVDVQGGSTSPVTVTIGQDTQKFYRLKMP